MTRIHLMYLGLDQFHQLVQCTLIVLTIRQNVSKKRHMGVIVNDHVSYVLGVASVILAVVLSGALLALVHTIWKVEVLKGKVEVQKKLTEVLQKGVKQQSITARTTMNVCSQKVCPHPMLPCPAGIQDDAIRQLAELGNPLCAGANRQPAEPGNPLRAAAKTPNQVSTDPASAQELPAQTTAGTRRANQRRRTKTRKKKRRARARK